VHDFVGEKLTETQVRMAVGNAIASFGLRPSPFACQPRAGSTPRYHFVVETLAESPPNLAESLDRALAEVTHGYHEARVRGFLGAATVEWVPRRTFATAFGNRHEDGQRPVGHVKDRALNLSPAALDAVMSAARMLQEEKRVGR
jgi:hypothetical protein